MTWFVFLVLVLREPGRPRSLNEHMDGGMLDTVYPMSHSHCAMLEVGRLEVGIGMVVIVLVTFALILIMHMCSMERRTDTG